MSKPPIPYSKDQRMENGQKIPSNVSGKQNHQSSKLPLWKQLVSASAHEIGMKNTNDMPELLSRARDVCNNSQYEQQDQDHESKCTGKQTKSNTKARCGTISNFLKHLQVQTQSSHCASQSQRGTQSEIVSIMDIGYGEQAPHREVRRRRVSLDGIKRIDIMQRDKLQALMKQAKFGVQGLKQEVQEFRQGFLGYFQMIRSKFDDVVSTMKSKDIQIRQLQLENRQWRVQSLQTQQSLQSKLSCSQNLVSTLTNQQKVSQQSLKSLKENIQICQQQIKQQRQYNRELNQIIFKFHARVQELEGKLSKQEEQCKRVIKENKDNLEKEWMERIKSIEEKFMVQMENQRIMSMNVNMERYHQGRVSSPQAYSQKSRLQEKQSKKQEPLTPKHSRNGSNFHPDQKAFETQTQSDSYSTTSAHPQTLKPNPRMTPPYLPHGSLSPQSTGNRRFERTNKGKSPSGHFDTSISNKTTKNVYKKCFEIQRQPNSHTFFNVDELSKSVQVQGNYPASSTGKNNSQIVFDSGHKSTNGSVLGILKRISVTDDNLNSMNLYNKSVKNANTNDRMNVTTNNFNKIISKDNQMRHTYL